MCTSLLYTDASGKAYFGRTLELTSDLPYQLVFFPSGLSFSSHLEGHAPLAYQSKFNVLAVTMPGGCRRRASLWGMQISRCSKE